MYNCIYLQKLTDDSRETKSHEPEMKYATYYELTPERHCFIFDVIFKDIQTLCSLSSLRKFHY